MSIATQADMKARLCCSALSKKVKKISR